MNSCYQPSLAVSRGKKLRKWIFPLACVVATALFVTNLLYDVECDSQDITQNGTNIFFWNYKKLPDISKENARAPLFASGAQSVNASFIQQGSLCDCNYLATVASFISQPSGAKKITQMIAKQPDGGYIVTFPGAPTQPVKIAALDPIELTYYAHARDKNGELTGLWLPVLEKAYGEYRVTHQDLPEQMWRSIKHGLLEGRWTSAPLHTGCAASFGAKDSVATALFTGHNAADLATTGFELGEFGIGKAYVTPRQVMGWFRRAKISDSFINEQNATLLDVTTGKAIATATTEQSTKCLEVGLRNKHAYSVTGYDCVKKQIYLYDPYGNTDYDSEDGKVIKRSGNFILTLEDFNKYFSHLHIEKVSPSVSLASL
ncbi:MAG TPA: C2 family cysteine protease [Drouetiella sp.]